MLMAAGKVQVPRLVRGSVWSRNAVAARRTATAQRGGPARDDRAQLLRGGRARAVMLPVEAVGAVRAAVGRYRSAEKALEDKGNAGLAELVATWASGGGGGSRPGRL